jgi:hypothetical protein
LRSIFGGGVATGLQEADAYGKFYKSYGCSGGGCTEAYWGAEQSRLGSSIYFEDLQEEFINKNQFFPGFFARVIHGTNINSLNGDIPQMINLDRLIRIFEYEKPLDIEKLRRSPIDFYVRVFDTKANRFDYLNLKEDTLRNLKRTAHVFPYYYDPSESRFLDAGLFEQIGYDALREMHPDKKIVFVINYSPKASIVRNLLKDSLASIVAQRMFPKLGLGKRALNVTGNFKSDIEKILADPNALLIHPPENSPTTQSTIDPKKLKATYQMGIDASKKILEWI